MGLTVLLGGARSGKSELSTRLAAASDRPVVVLVTAEARDQEMTERIQRHRASRPAAWTTIEEPVALAAAIGALESDAFLVLDCLSLWVSNVIEAGRGDEEIVDEAREVAALLVKREAPAVVVSNEVGLGIVPVNALARRYRDTLGRVNASFASEADRTYLMVAGRALLLDEVPV